MFFITIDEKSGKEKKSAHMMLVQASDLQDATARLEENMKTTMSDYRTASVTETELMDVFLYSGHGTDTNTKKYKGEEDKDEKKALEPEETVTRVIAEVGKDAARPAGIGYAAIKALDEAPITQYTPQQETTLMAEAMTTLPFTENAGGDRVEMERMRTFINKGREKKEVQPTLGMEQNGEPDPVYKKVVKAVINSGKYGMAIWKLTQNLGLKDRGTTMYYIKKMQDEGLAERQGESIYKKVSELPKRFL